MGDRSAARVQSLIIAVLCRAVQCRQFLADGGALSTSSAAEAKSSSHDDLGPLFLSEKVERRERTLAMRHVISWQVHPCMYQRYITVYQRSLFEPTSLSIVEAHIGGSLILAPDHAKCDLTKCNETSRVIFESCTRRPRDFPLSLQYNVATALGGGSPSSSFYYVCWLYAQTKAISITALRFGASSLCYNEWPRTSIQGER